MADSRNGYCLTGGPPGPAAPYSVAVCFQPAYVPNTSVGNNSFAWDALRCQQNGNAVGACSYSAECGPGAVCDAGRCWPSDKVHSPWTYDAGNPRVVADMSWEQVSELTKAMGMEASFREFAKHFAYGKSMFLVKHKGQTHVAAPLNVQYFRQDPQCSTCLKTIWQCNRFRDAAQYDSEAKQLYESCLELSECFLFDTMLSSGVLIPIMVKMNPVALPAAIAALQKCVEQCGDSQPFDALARGDPALFH
jgi:hypothetical protein